MDWARVRGWILVLAATSMAGAPPGAAAQSGAGGTSVQRTVPVRNPSDLAVRVPHGTLEVVGTNGMEARVEGTVAPGDSLVMTPGNRRLEIRVQGPEGQAATGPADLRLWIPRGTALDVESADADVAIQDAGGIVTVASGDGSVLVRGLVRTLTARTISGRVQVDGTPRSVFIQTATGPIDLSGARGFVEVSTTSGQVTLTDCLLFQGTVTSVDSDIVFRGALEGEGMLRLDSYAGNIEVHTSPSRDAVFEASTFGGDIVNGLGPAARDASRWAPGKELHFALGSGGGRMVLETYSGDITLRASGREPGLQTQETGR